MSDTLEFKGTWNPSLGAFPVITDDTTACYYLVSDAGYVDGYTFNQGDWLIYVEEPISPTETHGRWFRSEGGMVQVAPLQESPTPSFDEPGTYTKLTVNNAGVVVAGDFLTGTDIPTHSQEASTIQNLTPAARSAVGPMFVNTARSKAVDFEYDSDTNTVAADVKIDGVSIVKDEFGQLKVADSIASATGSVDVDGDQLFPPEEHTHAAVEIPDLKDAVRQALAHTPSGLDPFFSNTARSNAVVFNYDLATATVSADVKVDNSTIVKNKYGQLVAITSEVKAHTHTVEDIIGLNLDELQNMVAAGLQPLGLPPDGSYHDGAHDLEGTTINEAFDIINVDIKELTTSLTEISTDISAIKPVEPPSIEEIELELWKDYELFDAAIAGAEEEERVLALFDLTPKTEISARFAGSLERGTISAIIDGKERSSALKDVTEMDYYAGQPAYQGWYRSLTARIEVQSNLEVGAHTFQLQYSEGEVVKRSKVLNVYIAKARPAAGIDITGSSFQLSKSPAMTSFVSGIPAASNQEYEIGNLDVLNAVGKYYKPKEIASIRGHQPENLVLEEGQTQILVDPANIPAVDGTLQLKNIPITIANEYASPVTFSVACYDIFGNKSTERELGVDQNIRNDPSDESARVQSGSAADIYPTVTPGFCGDPFNSSASLSTGLYYSELQLINNRYRWPSGDFTKFGGPNYENTNGTRLNGAGPDSEEYRWFTLKFEVEDLLAFSMLFKRVDSEWPLTLNLTIPDIKMYGCIAGQTEWVDLNKPFVGYGGVDQIGQGALDVNKTTQDTRRITFGAGVGPYTGDLLIRVGLPKNTEYEIQSDISITPASY